MLKRVTGPVFLLLLPCTAWAGTDASVARHWRAWIDKGQSGIARLHVQGEVRTAGEPALSDNRLQGFNPAILFLDLETPPRSDARRFKPVRFLREAERINVTEVDIFQDKAMIARIPVKRRR